MTSARPPARRTNPHDPRRVIIGCVAMILSVLCFTLVDTINKVLVQTYSAVFLAWGRSSVQVG